MSRIPSLGSISTRLRRIAALAREDRERALTSLAHHIDVYFLSGEAFLIRYADDLVMVFASESDARRVLRVLPKRLSRFGLELSPEKTRLVSFRRPRGGGGPRSDRPGSFEFLGFTHFWGLSRKGSWVVKRKTAPRRLSWALRSVNGWCCYHRHLPLAWQHRSLVAKLRGHYGYYGIVGNGRSLGAFAYAVRRIWRRWLNRRSQRARMNWARFNLVLAHYPLPPPRIIHPGRRA